MSRQNTWRACFPFDCGIFCQMPEGIHQISITAAVVSPWFFTPVVLLILGLQSCFCSQTHISKHWMVSWGIDFDLLTQVIAACRLQGGGGKYRGGATWNHSSSFAYVPRGDLWLTLYFWKHTEIKTPLPFCHRVVKQKTQKAATGLEKCTESSYWG